VSNSGRTRFPASGHDHHSCVHSALRNAERYCGQKGLRLTPIRRRVLELIWQSHCPSGAYGLLGHLAADGHKPSPPTVYRALEFLLDNGLIHRVSSRNAFVGCTRPGQRHSAQIFVCDLCGIAVEQSDPVLDRQIGHNAQDLHFQIRELTVEVAGVCPRCNGSYDGA
jgi:Fur family zinc uptake transcriptional regulator